MLKSLLLDFCLCFLGTYNILQLPSCYNLSSLCQPDNAMYVKMFYDIKEMNYYRIN